MTVFDYAGYRIPVDLVNITGAGPDSFDDISQGHMAYLRQHVGICANASVLEVGCGIGRDAIPLTGMLSAAAGGRYTGIDIIGRSIAWCSENITPKHPNFTFIHFDVKDQLHNPGGSLDMLTISLPIEDNTVDVVILWSVFTHMFEQDIVHYLREFRRVLRPSGKIFFSCFIVDASILEAVGQTAPTPYALRFATSYGNGCWINDPIYPAGAVAYDEAALHRMTAAGGLRVAKTLYGNWSGQRSGQDGQDGMILVLQSATSLARRVFGALDQVSPRLGHVARRAASLVLR